MNRNFNDIPFRINFIRDILNGNNLLPLIDGNATDTEAFINKENKHDTLDVLNKESLNFNDVINKIGGKLVYVKSGTTGHTFRGFDPNDKNAANYAVKIVAYPIRENYGSYNDIKRPENAEIMMLKVLSYFVVLQNTPHIVLPIGTFNTSIKPFIGLAREGVANNVKYKRFVQKYEKKQLHSQVSVLISEWANNGDLLEYIREKGNTIDLETWRVLFFQIISVLVVIQTKYPNFRHNDMKANNILLHDIGQSRKNGLFKYTINSNIYKIPNIGIRIKLWDFDFACIKGIVNNSKVDAEWTDKINVSCERNRYYDIHYFFNILTKRGFYPQFWEGNNVHKEVKEFVRRIVPKKYEPKYVMKTNKKTGKEEPVNINPNVSQRCRLMVSDEYVIPNDILKYDPFFNKFREKK
jgi:serine/threonine protein kinase